MFRIIRISKNVPSYGLKKNIINISKNKWYSVSSVETDVKDKSQVTGNYQKDLSEYKSIEELENIKKEGKELSFEEQNILAKSKQAPNRAETWSKQQQPRSEAMTGPRFAGMDLSAQPAPYSAMELIAKQPIRYVNDRTAVCQGVDNLVQGHPKVFINLDKPQATPCVYCGIRYADIAHKEEIEKNE